MEKYISRPQTAEIVQDQCSKMKNKQQGASQMHIVTVSIVLLYINLQLQNGARSSISCFQTLHHTQKTPVTDSRLQLRPFMLIQRSQLPWSAINNPPFKPGLHDKCLLFTLPQTEYKISRIANKYKTNAKLSLMDATLKKKVLN